MTTFRLVDTFLDTNLLTSSAIILMISHVLLNSLSHTLDILETNFFYQLDWKS